MFAIKQRFVVNGKVARVTVSGCRGASCEDIEFFVADALRSDRSTKLDVLAARVIERCGDVASVEYID